MSLPFSPGRQDRVAISDLLRELLQKVSEFISTQIELTKTELKVESRKLVIAAVYAVIVLLMGSMLVFFVGLSIMLALTPAVGLIWASVITTAIYLIFTVLPALLMVYELRKKNDTIDVT